MTKISVQVRDDGGSNSGGIDLSTLKLFDIEVAPLPDTVAPTPSLSSLSPSITNVSPIDLTVDFGEAAIGFAFSDLVLTNGTAANLTDLGAGKFTVAISPIVDGVVTVSVPAAAANDLANNNSLASASFTRMVDRVVPVATITTTEASPTNKQSFPIVISFGEAVTGFDATDLVVGNATVTNLAETTPGRYTATVNALADGVVFLGFSAGVARDAAGNGNTAPAPLLISVNTGAATYKPLLSTTEPAVTSNRNFTATINFGRVVTGFEATDLELTNASVTLTDLGGGLFRINLSATSDGNVVIRLPADRVRDVNNRPNEASDTLTVRFVDASNSDFGDAPSATQSGFATSYPTLLANNGAFHKRSSLFLGASSDAEADGQPNATATGDDFLGSDDEDGIQFPVSLVIGSASATTASYVVIASGVGFVDAWIDFNRDGDWTDASEQMANKVPVVAGRNLLTFTIPVGSLAGTTYGRFRLSTTGGLPPTGPAADGEVEDHALTLIGGASKTVTLNAIDVGAHEISVIGTQLLVNVGGVTRWSAPVSEITKWTTIDGAGTKLFEAAQPATNLPGTVRYGGVGKPIELVNPRSAIDLSTLGADKLYGIQRIDMSATGAQSLALRTEDVNALNASKSLQVVMDSQDVLIASGQWKSQLGRIENSVWVQPFTSGGATVEVVSPKTWQNKMNPIDVDGDQSVSPLDVLALVNLINSNSLPGGKLPVRGTTTLDSFYDPDGDGSISPLDVLTVVNEINRRQAGGGGEGEQVDFIMAYELDTLISRDMEQGDNEQVRVRRLRSLASTVRGRN